MDVPLFNALTRSLLATASRRLAIASGLGGIASRLVQLEVGAGGNKNKKRPKCKKGWERCGRECCPMKFGGCCGNNRCCR